MPEKKKPTVIVNDLINFSSMVSNIESGFDRMYQLMPKGNTRINFLDIDIIKPRIAGNLLYNSFIIEYFTDNLGIPSIQSAAGLQAASNRFHTIQICSRYGIKNPITVYKGDFRSNLSFGGSGKTCATFNG